MSTPEFNLGSIVRAFLTSTPNATFSEVLAAIEALTGKEIDIDAAAEEYNKIQCRKSRKPAKKTIRTPKAKTKNRKPPPATGINLANMKSAARLVRACGSQEAAIEVIMAVDLIQIAK